MGFHNGFQQENECLHQELRQARLLIEKMKKQVQRLQYNIEQMSESVLALLLKKGPHEIKVENFYEYMSGKQVDVFNEYDPKNDVMKVTFKLNEQ